MLPQDIQSKLQALGISHRSGTHHRARDCCEAQRTGHRVEESLYLQDPIADHIDNVKAQYAAHLQDMQELQTKLTEGQKAPKALSEDYMKAVNQSPAPPNLTEPAGEPEQIPMAVEAFVHSLGIS